ncbi:alkane 1-monooxygenase [Phaeobacter sp. HF9A]|uniref:alkane 1-monooxygenase n=1 Tax=Phaeobacter sp. HF9A TaxID=2721561 RepID=UPI0014319DB2|nr:alkane 1-monooxygenase [Phaeobacter sp. HF9A]NIZ15208.1 alkane 1-monooxygenase [Phaeobacter sp. HF9A]
MAHYISTDHLRNWRHALPFWLSLLLLPLVWISALNGGWWILLPPLTTWYLFAALDGVLGLNLDNADPETTEADLSWYIRLTSTWVPLQFITLFGLIAYVSGADHLSSLERVGVFFGMGVISGTIGINYSHELMHQTNRLERWLADILLAMVMYSHFRSEHLLVHHRYVGTPRDPVTARYNEGFHRYYPRVLKECWHSAMQVEKARLAQKGLPFLHRKNPFLRYWALQAVMLTLALLLGGLSGVVLFLIQAGVAIWQLELINYIEHYGLTRKHLGDGRYEHVKPHHSWNAAHKASNWLLINLQRHSDHHYKPDRRFPLLQNYSDAEAPQLPYGYPIMSMAAMVPPLWRRVMNPKVRRWRQLYYPEITDWSAYSKASNPMPRSGQD